MRAGHITDDMWQKVCRLDYLEKALQDQTVTLGERRKLLRERHSIFCYLTLARVQQANRWRRRVLSIAMRRYPSMHVPPMGQFVKLPEIQDVIASEVAPPHWNKLNDKFNGRAAISIKNLLREFGFVIAAGRRGRPRRNT